MRRDSLMLALILLAWSFVAKGQKEDVGLGVVLGNPTGISAIYWTGDHSAIQLNMGYLMAREEHLLLSADFLVHPWIFYQKEDLIKPYLGLGGGLGFISDLSISVRLPLGTSYFFSAFPIEAFAELDPGLQLVGPGDVRFILGGYLGARWYF
jgi:hypothetical protein